MNTHRGFSLLETLVALAILSLSLGVIYQAQGTSVRAISQSLSLQKVLLHAQSLLAEHTGPHTQALPTSGTTADGLTWTVSRQPLELPPLLEGGPPVPVLRVDLDLAWSDGGRDRQLRLSTVDQP